MDKEDIIRMAREAGLAYGSDEKPLGSVTRFAALVAAAAKAEENEACAKVCEDMDHNGVMIAADCAAAIRARGDR